MIFFFFKFNAFAYAHTEFVMQIYEYLLNKNVGIFVAQLTQQKKNFGFFRFVNNFFGSWKRRTKKKTNDGYQNWKVK